MENVRVHKIVHIITNRKTSEFGENKVEQVAIVTGIIMLRYPSKHVKVYMASPFSLL
jgi:hypothetical protein